MSALTIIHWHGCISPGAVSSGCAIDGGRAVSAASIYWC